MSNNNFPWTLNPKLDLVLERVVDVPVHMVWKAWTDPKHLVKWFTPRPWKTVECKIDLRPGGQFYTVMQSPEGETQPPGNGCYLEVIENQRLVWTGALGPGFRPNDTSEAPFLFTAAIVLEEVKGSDGKPATKYTAIAMHSEEAGCKTHSDMGFHEGWGAALDQLVELAKTW